MQKEQSIQIMEKTMEDDKGAERFLLLRSFDGIDDNAFLELYRGTSEENAPNWYPDLTVPQALAKYEESYLEYIHGSFGQEQGILALLADDTGYRSGLRLYPMKEEHHYYIEALETRPDSRKNGYAAHLLRQTVKALEREAVFTSGVHKNNSASIATHLSAGFVREKEYFIEDGERDDDMVTMVYDNQGSGGGTEKRTDATGDLRPVNASERRLL